MSDKVICIIPARYASTRFPGKMLAPLAGKPMIQHVYERASEAERVDTVLVAADDERVIAAIESFGGRAVMTSLDHQSGTDRIHEAAAHIEGDVIINVQGDEPLLPSVVIDQLAALMLENPSIEMATVAVPSTRAELADPNRVKVALGMDGRALYFSRALIPYLREGGDDPGVYLHWGIYAYRRSTLEKFVKLPPGRLENCEKLEQLRALENGIGIHVLVEHELESIGVDTPEDLVRAEERLRMR